MKRLFIGIKITPSAELLDFYSKLKIRLKNDKIKWVPVENFHITLKFLGNTPSSIVPLIVRSIEDVVTKFERFSIEIKGLGCFKKQRRTSVIWLGLKKVDVLSVLAKEVDEAMESIGFELESRPFKAHLTIGRVKSLSNEIMLQKYVEEFKNVDFQIAVIEAVVLFESVLQRTGVKYEIIKGVAI